MGSIWVQIEKWSVRTISISISKTISISEQPSGMFRQNREPFHSRTLPYGGLDGITRYLFFFFTPGFRFPLYIIVQSSDNSRELVHLRWRSLAGFRTQPRDNCSDLRTHTRTLFRTRDSMAIGVKPNSLAICVKLGCQSIAVKLPFPTRVPVDRCSNLRTPQLKLFRTQNSTPPAVFAELRSHLRKLFWSQNSQPKAIPNWDLTPEKYPELRSQPRKLFRTREVIREKYFKIRPNTRNIFQTQVATQKLFRTKNPSPEI
jgi:hypothetical protein